MNRTPKIWLIAATSLILIGGIIFVITMATLHWDFSKLNVIKFEANTHEISEAFRHVSISTSTAEVTFLPSEDGACKVVCHESKQERHAVSVEAGVLTIKETDTRKWYDYINFFSFGAAKLTIYLPETDYGKLTMNQSTGDIILPEHTSFESMEIHTSTGDIFGKNITAGDIECSVSTGNVVMEKLTCTGEISVSVSTGDVKLTDGTCKSFTSTGSTGDVILKDMIATGTFSIVTDTGDVILDGCDAAELSIITDTGDVKGTLLTDKIFIVRTDTGRIEVPETITGGKCKITTDTGDIMFE